MQALLKLLRLTLGDTPGTQAAPQQPLDWPALIRLADEQTVTGLLIDSLPLLPAPLHPTEETRLSLLNALLCIEYDYSRQHRVLRLLLDELHALGTHPILIKGLSVASRYAHPSHRMMGDIDLYFPRPDEAALAVAWAQEHGTEVCRPTGLHLGFDWHDIHIEFHWDLIHLFSADNNQQVSRIVADALTRPLPQRDLGGGCIVTELPTDVYALFLLMHAAHHLVAVGIGLRHVVDWMLFLRAHHADIDPAQFAQWLHSLGMESVARAFASVCTHDLGLPEACLPCPLPYDAALRASLLQEMKRGGNMGKKYYSFRTQPLSLVAHYLHLGRIVLIRSYNQMKLWRKETIARYGKLFTKVGAMIVDNVDD